MSKRPWLDKGRSISVYFRGTPAAQAVLLLQALTPVSGRRRENMAATRASEPSPTRNIASRRPPDRAHNAAPNSRATLRFSIAPKTAATIPSSRSVTSRGRARHTENNATPATTKPKRPLYAVGCAAASTGGPKSESRRSLTTEVPNEKMMKSNESFTIATRLVVDTCGLRSHATAFGETLVRVRGTSTDTDGTSCIEARAPATRRGRS